jgi:hypothetical protein
MADNTTMDPGSGGDTIRTDDISGVKFPVSKIAIGVDGTDGGLISTTVPLPVELGFVSPQTSTGTAVATAAGSSADIDSTQIGSGNTGKLIAFTVASTSSFKYVLSTVLNNAETAVLTDVCWLSTKWTTPHRDMFTVAEDATAGLDGFRLAITNLDTSAACDSYATFFWDEV